MSLLSNLQNFATAVATDYKQLRVWMTGSSTGDLTGLNTTAKTSLVAAINEVKSSSAGAPPSATQTTAGVVQLASPTEAAAGVDTAKAITAADLKQETNTVRNNLLNGAGAAFDTLKELQDLITNDESTATALATTVGQKANSTDVWLKTDIGDPTTDLVAAYTAAKA
jgi:hypothetical protein